LRDQDSAYASSKFSTTPLNGVESSPLLSDGSAASAPAGGAGASSQSASYSSCAVETAFKRDVVSTTGQVSLES